MNIKYSIINRIDNSYTVMVMQRLRLHDKTTILSPLQNYNTLHFNNFTTTQQKRIKYTEYQEINNSNTNTLTDQSTPHFR